MQSLFITINSGSPVQVTFGFVHALGARDGESWANVRLLRNGAIIYQDNNLGFLKQINASDTLRRSGSFSAAVADYPPGASANYELQVMLGGSNDTDGTHDLAVRNRFITATELKR